MNTAGNWFVRGCSVRPDGGGETATADVIFMVDADGGFHGVAVGVGWADPPPHGQRLMVLTPGGLEGATGAVTGWMAEGAGRRTVIFAGGEMSPEMARACGPRAPLV